MKNDEITNKLNDLYLQAFSFEDLDTQIQSAKEGFVLAGDEEQAKILWIYQRIIEIHILYINAFTLLKLKEYYKGWCQLERIEITFKNLKKHFSFDKTLYQLWHIEKSVKNLQVLFPYRIFASSELLKKKKKCSVCDKEISIRNPCGHYVGEIYSGEMCYRIVTEVEVLGVSLVENPGNKFAVMFVKDENTDEQTDQYNYDTIDYLFDLIESPYDIWNLEVSQRELPTHDSKKIGRNEFCDCNSGKKFKKCCMRKNGEKYAHYEFILTNPSTKTLFTNTLK